MKKPSFLDMIKNFASEITEYAKKGAPNVTESEYAERVQECDACPHLDRENMRCGLCGCFVEHKARWQTSNCPDHRWPRIVVGARGKNCQTPIPDAASSLSHTRAGLPKLPQTGLSGNEVG